MTGSGYLDLVALRSARRLLTALVVAWTSFGMVGLALFLTAHRATGSTRTAGFVVAAFSVGSAVCSPLRGRLIDRRGARPWLPLLAVAYGVSLAAVLAAGRTGSPGPVAAVFALTAGATAPPVVATTRGLWSTAVEPGLRRRAYALTSLIGDAGLVIAPAAGGLLFVALPWAPLAVCAIAAPVAALIVALIVVQRDSGAALPTVGQRAAGGPASRQLRVLLTVSVALGAALGLVEVTVPAAAARWHVTGDSGLLLGAFALGSVAGGLWFGRRSWRRPALERYLWAVLALALLLAPATVATRPAELAPLLVVAGLAFGPATISLFEALDAVAPAGSAAALTWVTSAEAAGAAAGAALAGVVATGVGTWAPYPVAAALLAAAAAAGLRVGQLPPR